MKSISMKFGMGLPSSGYAFCDGRVNFELRRADGHLIRVNYFGRQPLGSPHSLTQSASKSARMASRCRSKTSRSFPLASLMKPP